MRKSLAIALAGLAWCSQAAAAEFTNAEKALLRKIQADPSKRAAAVGMLSTAPSAPAEARKPKAAVVAATKEKPIFADIFGDLVRKQENEAGVVPLKPKLTEYSGCPGFKFLLRQDWKDIGFLECPKAAADAVGAEIAYADDRAAHNRIWSMNGTAALVYSSATSSPPEWWMPYYTSFATYATVNRTLNSAAALATSNVDKLAYGASLELGWESPGGANYVRIRGGQVENNIKNTTSANVTAELIPVYYPLYIHFPYVRPLGLPISTRFDPELLIQYSQVTGKNGVLDFNGRSQALRVGPQLSFYLYPEVDPTSILSRINASLTYHWSYETYSGKPIDWLQTALTYNIDDAGHLALSLTYKHGRDEDTGTLTDIYRIGLTGKI